MNILSDTSLTGASNSLEQCMCVLQLCAQQRLYALEFSTRSNSGIGHERV